MSATQENETQTEADAPDMKSSRGTWIAVVVVVVLTTLGTVVAAFAMNRAIESSPVPAWGRKVGEGADILLDAETAPGVTQLRELGCASATILDVERMLDFLATQENAGPRPDGAPIHAARCWSDGAVDCAAVARVVGERGRLRGDIATMVIRGNRSGGTTTCSERYDAEGRHLGAFDAASLPLP